MKNNTTGSTGVKAIAHNLSQPQTSSCSQTSEDTVRNMSNNSNSSCNSTIKNDLNDSTQANTNQLNKNYDISFKSQIDENDSTSPRSLRIADQETDPGESFMCFDDDDDDRDEDDDEDDDQHEVEGDCGRQTESGSNSSQNCPSVSDDNKALTVDNRVYRIEACNEKNVNVIAKNLSSDSHSL
jgi:enoyl reductase-like protein